MPTYDPCGDITPYTYVAPADPACLETIEDEPQGPMEKCAEFCKAVKEREQRRCTDLRARIGQLMKNSGCPYHIRPDLRTTEQKVPSRFRHSKARGSVKSKRRKRVSRRTKRSTCKSCA